MSLIMCSSDWAELITSERYSRCSAVSGVSRQSCVMPRMPFIGVRISWLILARKALLASFASRASFAASMASSSAALRRVISCKVPITRSACCCMLRVTICPESSIQRQPCVGCWTRSSHSKTGMCSFCEAIIACCRVARSSSWTRLSIKRSGKRHCARDWPTIASRVSFTFRLSWETCQSQIPIWIDSAVNKKSSCS